MDWKIVALKCSVCQQYCFHHCSNIFGILAPSDVVTTPVNQLAWRNKHWINNELTEKITTNMLFMFDLTFWAFFAGGQDGLFYCAYSCWVLCCKSKPRFCLCYNRWEEVLVVSDFIQWFLAQIHTLLLLISSVFIDDFTHLLWVFVCVTCRGWTWMLKVFNWSSAMFASGRALKICSPNGTVLKAVLSISCIFNAGFWISKQSNTNVLFLQISCQKIAGFT